MIAHKATLIEPCTYWQLHYMQNCVVMGFHFQMWKSCANSKTSLMWGANSCMSDLFLLQVDAWFLVTQDYVHIFTISPLIVLRTLWLLVLWGMKELQKCCPFMLLQDDVPKSNRKITPVVSRGFEESAMGFWSPLYGLEKFPVNKQFFENSILSVQFIQPTYAKGALDFSSGWTRLPFKIKCWQDNFLQIQIVQCKHLASKIMQRT